MEFALRTTARALCTVTGAALAGPVGAVVGGLAGGLVATVLPPAAEFVGQLAESLTSHALDDATGKLVSSLDPETKLKINHDLQTAFRDGFHEALYDLGGERCFPKQWKVKRDVPPGVVYPSTPEADKLWHEEDPLAGQVTSCLQLMDRAVAANKLLPLDPPLDQPAAGVKLYLEADSPEALNDAFFSQVVSPFLAGFGSLTAELPGLEQHLRHHLLDRTLVHLGEMLKARAPAWRAFNRLMLEGLRGQVGEIQAGQSDLADRLDALLARSDPQAMADWSSGLADLLTATGQVEKRLSEGLDTVLSRVVDQHAEVRARLDGLLVVTVRIETKIDRVLRYLEDGRYVIEGSPSVPIDEPPAPGTPPFKGLQHFDEGDADLFFGRELLTAKLAGQLRHSRFLAVVVGASGSGKSSAVRAGLIPALKRGGPLADGTHPPRGSTRWPVHIITPTAHPLQALAASLTRASESVTATVTLMEDLARDPRSLGLYVRKLLSAAPSAQPGESRAEGADHLLLVVDQFEELFTLCEDPAERKVFVNNLLVATLGRGQESGLSTEDGKGPTVVVVTLRADFYAHCAQYANLRDALEQHQAYIGPMSSEELRRAIEEPARLGGWEFERGLVDLMLRDVGDEPGALPLLSHALLETWQHRRGRVMTLESYAEAGGVRGAIAKTAESVYSGLTEEQQAIARRIFLRLTELGEGTQDTRRRAAIGELIPSPEAAPTVTAVLKTLTDARLLTTDEDPATGAGEPTAEVAHEALIREWPTLRRWLDEDRAGLRVHRHLTEAAREWARLERDEGLLYRGARLAEAGEWAAASPAEMNLLEREFVDASVHAAQREADEREAQRQRELEAARKVAQAEKERAEAQAQRAEEQERRAEEQVQNSKRLRKRALLLAGALAAAVVFLVLAGIAARIASSEGKRAEQQAQIALEQKDVADEQREQADAARAVAVSEGKRAEEQAQIALSRQLAAQALNELGDTDRALLLSLEANRLSDAPEVRGSLLVALESSPHLVGFLHGHSASVWKVAFSPDGKMLASAGADGTVVLWDPATQQRLGEPMAVQHGPVYSLAFSPDGTMLATGSGDGTILLWDVGTRQALSQPLTGHTDRVWSLAFSPDGQTLASGSRDRSVILWEVAAGAARRVLTSHKQEVFGVAFAPDGSLLASGSADGTILLWDVASGTPVGQPLTSFSFGRTNDDMLAIAFSPDGQTLAAGVQDGTAILWDVQSRQQIGEPFQVVGSVQSVAFSPDSQILATGSGFATVVLWDVATGQRIGLPFTGHSGPVNGVAFSPVGGTLASASGDHAVILWSIESSQVRDHSFAGHTAPVFSLAFSPDGKTVLASGMDKDISAWDVASGQPLGQFVNSYVHDTMADDVITLAFSPDGRMVASGGASSILLWDADTHLPIGEPFSRAGWVDSVAFSPDGQVLASGGENGDVLLWDVANHQLLAQLLRERPLSIYSVALSPDGRRLACGTEAHSIILWDLDSRERLGQPLYGHSSYVYGVAFSPDGKLIASGDSNGAIILWDAMTGNQIGQLPQGHSDGVNGLAFSPDGRTLASGSSDKQILLWDVATLQMRGEPLLGHTDGVLRVAFSPDGKTLASSSSDKTVRLWDIEAGEPRGEPLSGHLSSVWGLAFSPDGKLLASGSCGRLVPDTDECDQGQVLLWDVAAQRQAGEPLVGHSGRVWSVAFSPDGTALASGSNDKSILIWDVASRQTIGQPLRGHQSAVYDLAFAPDGRLVSGSQDGTLVVWDVAAQRRIGEPLSQPFSHARAAVSVRFSPDGKTLASGSEDKTIILWDVATRRMIGQPLTGHEDGVKDIAFSPDGRVLASGSKDGTIILWDVASRQPIGEPLSGHASWVDDVVFSPDGKTLASGGCSHWGEDTGSCDTGEIRLWDVDAHRQDGEPLTAHAQSVMDVAFGADGQTLASGSWDGTVIVWDVRSRQPRYAPLVVPGGDVLDIAFSPDGQRLASAGEDNNLMLWDVDSRQGVGRPLIGPTVALQTEFSPDGKVLASRFSGGAIMLWDLTAEPPVGVTISGTVENDMAFSPDGQTLASGGCGTLEVGACTQGQVRRWEVATRQPVGQPLAGHAGYVTAVAYSQADGNMLASGGADGSVILWDLAKGQPRFAPLAGHVDKINDLAFSPDGSILASASNDSTVVLWDVSTGQRIGQPLLGRADTVIRLAFSPDGKTVAAGYFGGKAILWDVETGQPAATLAGHETADFVYGLAFSPGGRLLASAGDDGKILLWDLSLASWQERACRVAGRNLTRVEWDEALPGEAYRQTCEQWPLEEEIAAVSSAGMLASPSPQATPIPQPLATAAPLPTATRPSPSGEIVASELRYWDDFSNPYSGWTEASDEDSTSIYKEGSYDLTLTSDSYFFWGRPNRVFSDFVVEVEASHVEGPADNYYGVILRYIDGNNFYYFAVAADGTYRFVKYDNDVQFNLIDWTESSAIRTGNATNTIKVACQGDTFTFFVNGEKVGSYVDGAFASGDIGLMAGNGASEGAVHVAFDNLKLWALE